MDKGFYSFHVEDTFSLPSLAKGIKTILEHHNMSTYMEWQSDGSCIISGTNVSGKSSTLLRGLSGTVLSISVYLKVENNELKLSFGNESWADKATGYVFSTGIPFLAFTATFGGIRQIYVEREILDYVSDVCECNEVRLMNLSVKQRIMMATPIISLIIFLTMGFVFQMWSWGCLAFLLIPLMPVFLGELNPEYIFPLVVTAIYFGLGFGLNLWHPAWIIFLTIPVYYILFPVRARRPMKKNYNY